MAEDKSDDKDAPKRDYEPPAGAEMSATWAAKGVSTNYTASATWTVLRKKEKPAAEIFSVAYVAHEGGDRPVTFIFNGGPGARRRPYLQMGAAGPLRVAFPPDGTLPPMPPRLVPNDDSWLGFTDLVFVDPVGTGFSRVIEDEATDGEKKKDKGDDSARETVGYKRDLESLCEFMSRWLSAHGRWGSPVLIAGESYGGYRVGRLVRLLQESTGVGLSAAVLHLPRATEFGSLVPTDYDVLGWVDLLPTMALAATSTTAARVRSPPTRRRSRCGRRRRRSRPATTRPSWPVARRCRPTTVNESSAGSRTS